MEDEKDYNSEVKQIKKVLDGVEVPVYRILESQMGDPVLSHWIGPEGVVVGTALGRVSAYLFDEKSGDGEASEPTDQTPGLHSLTPASSQTPPSLLQRLTCLAFKSRRAQSKPDISQVIPGRYVVYASFSDDAIRAVFIHDALLYTLIGSNLFCIYDISTYSIKEEFNLEIDRSSGYKQIAFFDNKILVESMRGSTLIDPIGLKQSKTFSRSYPSNLLDFANNSILCCHRKKEFMVQVFVLDEGLGANRLVTSITMGKRTHLVTHARFWFDRIVVVVDMLKVFIYDYNKVQLAQRRLSHDIITLCTNFATFLMVLTKNGYIHFLHKHTLATFFTISLHPATFELGWPYTLVSHEDLVSFTSDEGVYCFRLPRKLLRTTYSWD